MYDASAVRLGMPAEMFTATVERRLAYVKATRSEQVAFISADAPVLEPGHIVFVLYAADGEPIMLAESREAVLEDAERQELETVSLH
jgi:hypothetical protein